MTVPTATLDEATRHVDADLFDIEREIDWLDRISPLDNAARWEAFQQSGYTVAPPLTYPAVDLDVGALRQRLDRLPMDDIGHAALRALLAEKRTELERLLVLVESRDTPAFAAVSVGVFGSPEPELLAEARTILATVPTSDAPSDLVGADMVVAAAAAARERYAAIVPDFDFRIELVDDSDAILVVHHGDLVVDRHLRIPRSRVEPLVAHEVGVHVVTRYNGAKQPLRLFESGFAHYDLLQEGLATFCEYLAGHLPATRLRVLAARVVAADLAVGHEPLESIFHHLHGDHGMDAKSAFDVAVRAARGGGLTKDALYLAGLRDVRAWLADGGDIAELFVGKFALRHRHLVAELLDEGLLVPAALLPDCVTDTRLRDAIDTPLTALFHTETAR